MKEDCEFCRGQLYAARRCAEIAEKAAQAALDLATHQDLLSCEHGECIEQRSMARMARGIAKDIRREFGLDGEGEEK